MKLYVTGNSTVALEPTPMSSKKNMLFFQPSKRVDINDPVDINLLAMFQTPEKEQKSYPIMCTSQATTTTQFGNVATADWSSQSAKVGFSSNFSPELTLRGSVTPLK